MHPAIRAITDQISRLPAVEKILLFGSRALDLLEEALAMPRDDAAKAPLPVMPGLDPGIHPRVGGGRATWIAGSSPAMTKGSHASLHWLKRRSKGRPARRFAQSD
jgi:hypothetical protein